jgi:hypothetical protein
MKTTLFTFKSPVGTFWIRPEPADRVQLSVDSKRLKTYSSPKLAAKAVADRTTGLPEWDLATEHRRRADSRDGTAQYRQSGTQGALRRRYPACAELRSRPANSMAQKAFSTAPTRSATPDTPPCASCRASPRVA